MKKGLRMRQLGCLILLTALLAEFTDGARSISVARGFRTGSYSSYRSGSSRFGSVRGTGYSTLALLVSYRFTTRTIRSAYARGIIFASPAWRASNAHYAEGTTLCFNIRDSPPDNYIAASNSSDMAPWLYKSRQVYGIFVCPMEESRRDATYCCGGEERQRCCSFWEDPGRVAGLFLGLIGGLIAVLAAAYYIHKRFFKNKRVVRAATESQQVTLHPVATNLGDTSMAQDTSGSSTFAPHQQLSDPSADKQLPPAYSVEQVPYRFVWGPNTQQTLPPPPAYWEASNYSGVQDQPSQMPTSH